MYESPSTTAGVDPCEERGVHADPKPTREGQTFR